MDNRGLLPARVALVATVAASIAAAGLTTVSARAAVDNDLTLVSVGDGGAQPNGDSDFTAVSADGRYVAFGSRATNLTSAVTPPGFDDNVYLRDTLTGTTTLINHKNDGSGNGRANTDVAISPDGRYVAYPARVGVASSGEKLMLWDRDTDTTTTISKTATGDVMKGYDFKAVVSGVGTVVYTIRDSKMKDAAELGLYSYDIASDTTTALLATDLVYPAFNPGDYPAVSTNGRVVAYVRATKAPAGHNAKWQLVRLDTQTDTRTVVWTTGRSDAQPSVVGGFALNNTGRYLSFAHAPAKDFASPTVPTSVVAVYDAQTGTTELVSRAAAGGKADGRSAASDISADGRYVSYLSDATNILATATDTPGLYVYDRQSGTTTRIGVNLRGNFPRNGPILSHISDDGNTVSFTTTAGNMSDGATGSTARVYVWTRPAP